MECLAQVATAIGKPDLAKLILKLVVIKEDDKEEETIAEVVNVKEDEWASLKQEGNQLYKQNRWREAMNCYTRAIHLNQEEAVLYSNRALCEFNLLKFDLAREDIEDAIQLDPKNVKYYRILSEVLLEMKMHKESLAACLQGLEINPRDEVLNVRERDCCALVASDKEIITTVFCGKDQLEKKFSRIKNLYLTSEDIEDLNLDQFTKLSQISNSVVEANYQLEHGRLSNSIMENLEEKAFYIFEAAAKLLSRWSRCRQM